MEQAFNGEESQAPPEPIEAALEIDEAAIAAEVEQELEEQESATEQVDEETASTAPVEMDLSGMQEKSKSKQSNKTHANPPKIHTPTLFALTELRELVSGEDADFPAFNASNDPQTYEAQLDSFLQVVVKDFPWLNYEPSEAIRTASRRAIAKAREKAAALQDNAEYQKAVAERFAVLHSSYAISFPNRYGFSEFFVEPTRSIEEIAAEADKPKF